MELELSSSVFAAYRLEGRTWKRVSDYFATREPAERVLLNRQRIGALARYRVVEFVAKEEV